MTVAALSHNYLSGVFLRVMAMALQAEIISYLFFLIMARAFRMGVAVGIETIY